MPVYQYKGKHYSLNETDPEKAATKIKGFVGDGALPEVSAPKEPTSAPKAYGKALAEQAGGTAGAWAGAKAGLKLGLKAPGITKLVAAPIGTIVGSGLGFWAGQKAQKEALEQVPESVKEKVGFDRAQRAREKGEQPAASTLGEWTPTIAGLGTLGYKGAKALSKLSPSKIMEKLGPPSSVSDVGEKLEGKVTGQIKSLIEARKPEAQKAFDSYLSEGAQNERNILSDYQQSIRDYYAKNASNLTPQDAEFLRTSLQRTEGRPALISGANPEEVPKVLPGIKALEAERRYLQNIESGYIREGFDSIRKDTIGNVKNILEQSIRNHVPEKFDNAKQLYAQLSEPINKYNTALGQKVLTKADDFLPELSKIDPANLPNSFFKSRRSINELKELSGDVQFVDQLAREHISTELKNVTKASEIRSYINKNADWLQELPEIKKELEQAQSAISRIEKFKTGATMAAGGAIGAGAVSKASRLLGGN